MERLVRLSQTGISCSKKQCDNNGQVVRLMEKHMAENGVLSLY